MNLIAKRWVESGYGGLNSLRLIDARVPDPRPDEVTIKVRAAGVNPIDYWTVSGQAGKDNTEPPLPIGFEVAGTVLATGADAHISTGPVHVGDEVLAFRIQGGYCTVLTAAAADVFAKPARLGFPEAANLLLAGTAAAEMMHVTRVSRGDTVLIHGASGAVGLSAVQQAKLLGARVIGTASKRNFALLRHFGAEPVVYGTGLERRVRELAPAGVAAVLETVGTDDAVDASLVLVPDRSRIVTTSAFQRAKGEGFRFIGGGQPESAAYRDSARATLVSLAGHGDLTVPIARTFPLTEAPDALKLIGSGHPGGKLALLP